MGAVDKLKFYKDRLKGLHGKERVRLRKRLYYQANKELFRTRRAAWASANKEKLLEYGREYYRRNPERMRLKRERSRERMREYSKRWYEANKEKRQQQIKQYRLDNPEWHRQIVNSIARRRRVKKKGALGSHTYKEWEYLKFLYDYICPKCLRKEPEIQLTEDHKIPLSKGGTDYIDNIQPLCGVCNSSKNSKIWFASCPLRIKTNVQAQVST